MAELRTLITPQTAAVTIEAGFVCTKGRLPVTISAPLLAAAEVVPILQSVDNGASWQAVQKDGAAITLTATNNVVTIYGCLHVGVTKPITAGLVGVFAQHNDLVQG